MSRFHGFSSRSSNPCPSTNYSAKSGTSSEIVIDQKRAAKADVAKHVSTGYENDPRGHTSGVISAGSGDRIRTCDLWVMS
jgi:hypothetical protein